MSGSMSFSCVFCASEKGCKIKPANLLKSMDKKSGYCFSSKKSVDVLKDAVWGNKKRGKRKKLIKPVEETENANG